MENVEREKIAILGAGSYGTALAYVSSHNHDVVIFCRDEEQARTINEEHYNPKRLKTAVLPKCIRATTDFLDAVEEAAAILHCIPAQHTPDFIKKYGKLVPANVPFVSTCKGIFTKTGELMSTAIEKAFAGRATDSKVRAEVLLAYLSGPSFAAEMVKEDPMSVVVASHDTWCATRVQTLLSSKFFRIYTTDDVVGVEIGGALKNPLAIGTGCAQGLGFGQSTIAGIVTRGCLEMSQLSLALGGRRETLAGLSGVGDLMLTCYSEQSRNNRFGRCLAQGMTPDQACETIGEVVEGYPTAIEVAKLAKQKGLFLPLFFAVEKLVTGQRTPLELFDIMMLAPPAQERFIG